jgi:hypothetical protein
MFKNHIGLAMKRDTSQVKFTIILVEFTPASILGVSAGNGQSSGG